MAWILKTNKFVLDSAPELSMRSFTNEAALVWPSVRKLVQRGLYDTDLLDSNDVFAAIAEGRAVLFVGYVNDIPTTAAVIELQQYPRGAVAEVISAAGQWHLFYSFIAFAKVWLRANNVKRLRCICRPAQARLFTRLTEFKSTGQQILEINF